MMMALAGEWDKVTCTDSERERERERKRVFQAFNQRKRRKTWALSLPRFWEDSNGFVRWKSEKCGVGMIQNSRAERDVLLNFFIFCNKVHFILRKVFALHEGCCVSSTPSSLDTINININIIFFLNFYFQNSPKTLFFFLNIFIFKYFKTQRNSQLGLTKWVTWHDSFMTRLTSDPFSLNPNTTRLTKRVGAPDTIRLVKFYGSPDTTHKPV
jgi:hypothetical protein